MFWHYARWLGLHTLLNMWILLSVNTIYRMHTLLCSMTRALNSCSKSLLTRAASIVEAQRGGSEGQPGTAPAPHTDRTASWDIAFQWDSFWKWNWHTSTESNGWNVESHVQIKSRPTMIKLLIINTVSAIFRFLVLGSAWRNNLLVYEF